MSLQPQTFCATTNGSKPHHTELQEQLRVAHDDLRSLQHDIDRVRRERDDAQALVQRLTTARRQAEASKLGTFTSSLTHLLSIATRLRGLHATPARFATADRNSVPPTFQLPPLNSP